MTELRYRTSPESPQAALVGDAFALRRGALAVFAGVLAALVCAAWVLARADAAIGLGVVPLAAGLFAGITAVALASLPGGHPHRRFGPANTVTTVRAAMTALAAALLPQAERIGTADGAGLAWGLAALVAAALLLDGVDGRMARRSGLESRFGARYDMEVDALLILVLSLFAYAGGKAGAFVLSAGLMRYGFLLVLALAPRLRGELAPSLRRKAVCVLQVAGLGALLLPPLAPPASQALALAVCLALAWSFAVDLAALARAARRDGSAGRP